MTLGITISKFAKFPESYLRVVAVIYADFCPVRLFHPLIYLRDWYKFDSNEGGRFFRSFRTSFPPNTGSAEDSLDVGLLILFSSLFLHVVLVGTVRG